MKKPTIQITEATTDIFADMKAWEYRLVMHVAPDRKSIEFCMHVAFDKNEKGEPTKIECDPCEVFGDSPEAVRATLQAMLAALDKPVLDGAKVIFVDEWLELPAEDTWLLTF